MKGIIVKQTETGNWLEYQDVPAPQLESSDLLIEVMASGVNRTDLMTRNRQAGYADEPVPTEVERVELGVEISGVVVQIGDAVTDFSVGDHVMGLVDGGGYAEYAAMPASRAMHIPEGLEFTDAAAIPEVFLTAYQNLFWHGQLSEGQTVLIHAGASGVGTAAIQLVKQVPNTTVIVTAGSQEKLTFCQSLGADVLINYKEENFAERVLEATDGRGADIIMDFVGASYWSRNLESIAVEGRWLLIGALGGSLVPEVQLFDLMKKFVTLTGTLLTPRTAEYKARLSHEFLARFGQAFTDGQLRPVVDRVFDLSEAEAAQKRMKDNLNIGKILLTNRSV